MRKDGNWCLTETSEEKEDQGRDKTFKVIIHGTLHKYYQLNSTHFLFIITLTHSKVRTAVMMMLHFTIVKCSIVSLPTQIGLLAGNSSSNCWPHKVNSHKIINQLPTRSTPSKSTSHEINCLTVHSMYIKSVRLNSSLMSHWRQVFS